MKGLQKEDSTIDLATLSQPNITQGCHEDETGGYGGPCIPPLAIRWASSTLAGVSSIFAAPPPPESQADPQSWGCGWCKRREVLENDNSSWHKWKDESNSVRCGLVVTQHETPWLLLPFARLYRRCQKCAAFSSGNYSYLVIICSERFP